MRQLEISVLPMARRWNAKLSNGSTTLSAKMGARFDQRKFHDFILAQGLLPPDLLRKAVLDDFVGAGVP